MAAGTMNIISNLNGKVRTILFEKMSLKILNPNRTSQRLCILIAFARSQQIRILSKTNRLYI